jgi:A/G-specific adenine glycosylase
VLVAAVMAQQTQMSRVLPKFAEFVTAFPTVEALAEASTGDVLRAWAPLGYNMRALRLQRAAQRVLSMGGFPRSAGELQQIDGIGPFTAAIIASFAFGEPAAAIDTNVVRVLSRLFPHPPLRQAQGKLFGQPLPRAGEGSQSAGRLRRMAQELISHRAPGRWNQALMDLGAVVCTSRAPKCGACPIARWCAYPSPSPFPQGKGNTSDQGERRVAEKRSAYKTKEPFAGSTRYYRGRIVQALRELPAGESMSAKALLASIPQRNGLDMAGLRTLLVSLQRDGLVRVERGRVRLP